MRMRRKPWARPELEACSYYVDKPENFKGIWSEQFPEKQPLHVELGCGKGVSTAELVFRNPNINFIAIDIKSEVLAVAKRNISRLFEENGRKPENILLLIQNIEQIDRIFSKDDQVEVLYINFCNPWPKKKHKKRRLTYPRLLELYKSFLKEDGKIFFKTDDDELFEESLEYFSVSGFDVIYKTYDLHNSEIEGNILTEHEKMFSEQGIKIKYCEAVLRKEKEEQ